MAQVEANNHPFPATHAAVITPSDVTTFQATRGLYIGGTGNITVTMAGDSADVLFSTIPAGAILPIRVTAIKSTGTTATTIVAMW